MLSRYYFDGARLEDFDLSDVRWDDNLVEYDTADISPDILPKLTGENFWWLKPPPPCTFLYEMSALTYTYDSSADSIFEALRKPTPGKHTHPNRTAAAVRDQ